MESSAFPTDWRKKMLFANTFAATVDWMMEKPLAQLGTVNAWMLAVLYTLQIYFDFSGYSDMAIGLGKMFGFDFMENFNYPYISTSIREFWRRWHISLSTWFREYLYIPLGGNRKGQVRTYINLLIVFFATGLWHGAGATFIIWGLYHGCFWWWNRMGLGKLLEKNCFRGLNHIYTALVGSGWLGVLPRRYAGGCESDPASDVYLGERHLSGVAVRESEGDFSCGAGRAAFGHRAEYMPEAAGAFV